MSLLTLNGLPVIRAEITFPLVGLWQGFLEVDTDKASDMQGAVTLSIADSAITWEGAIFRGGTFAGSGRALVVGGKGGLVKQAPPKSFKDVPYRVVLKDTLGAVGETLATASDPATLAKLLPFWVRTEAPAGRTIASLALEAGVNWRMLLTGDLYFGPDNFAPFTDDFAIVWQDDAQGSADVDLVLPSLLPGVSLGGRKVGRVVHTFEAANVKTRAWFQDA